MKTFNLTRRTTLAQDSKIAKDPFSRARGLLGRKTFGAGEALWITSCNSIHMMFMGFPIDAVFLDKQGIVVGLIKNIQPFSFSPIFWKATCVVELPVGVITESRTEIGDRIALQE